jgi:phosphatidylinositol alpha-mannosyltransferase
MISSAMKILAGLPWRLDWDVSGLAKHINECFSYIADLGIDVEICCLGSAGRTTKFAVSEIKVKTAAERNVYSPLINSIAFSHEFSKITASKEYDVLHCFNTTSLFLTDRKYMFQTNNPTYSYALEVAKDEYPQTLKYEKLLRYYASVAEIERLEYENAELVVATSEVVKENVVKYCDVDRGKVVVIPSGVSPEACNFRRPPRRADDLNIVLFPGTIHIMKGFHYLVEAMARVRKELPNTILLVCGRIHPYEYEIFKDLIDRRRKESGIVLAGFMAREKLYTYYHLADVCCIPLLYGTMSMANMEAMAHGLPLVTTVHSGIPEIEEVGLKVPPKDSDAIADALLRLLTDDELWEKKSRNTERTVARYLWGNIAEQFLNVYERLNS